MRGLTVISESLSDSRLITVHHDESSTNPHSSLARCLLAISAKYVLVFSHVRFQPGLANCTSFMTHVVLSFLFTAKGARLPACYFSISVVERWTPDGFSNGCHSSHQSGLLFSKPFSAFRVRVAVYFLRSISARTLYVCTLVTITVQPTNRLLSSLFHVGQWGFIYKFGGTFFFGFCFFFSLVSLYMHILSWTSPVHTSSLRHLASAAGGDVSTLSMIFTLFALSTLFTHWGEHSRWVLCQWCHLLST